MSEREPVVPFYAALNHFRYLAALTCHNVSRMDELAPKERVAVLEVLLRDLVSYEDSLRTHSIETVDVPTPRREVPHAARERILERDGHRCLACGSDGDLHIDHVVPLAVGGAHAEENFQTLCGPCNMAKAATAVDYRIPVSL